MERSLEKKWVDLYLSNADMIGEGLPSPVNRARAGALEQFNLLGIPAKGSGNGDRYHYTGLRELFDGEYEHYFTPSYAKVGIRPLDTEGEHLTLLNGFPAGGSARPLVRYPDGTVFGSLAAAAAEYPELVGTYYNTLCDGQGDALSALNTVFAQDGVFLYVPRGVRAERPFVVTFGHYADGERVCSFARSLFIFGEASRAQVVIDNRSEGDGECLGCQVREVFAGDGAQADLVELFRLNGRSSVVSSAFAAQQDESRFHTLSVALGARLMRSNQHVRLMGPRAENHTNGLTLSSAGEHFDFSTNIEHVSPDCTSYEHFKGIASGDGTSVFAGRIYVAQDAQRTQAYQQNNNLLLGADAHVYSKPQLEIYADNVKCSHGATVGRLNAEAVYYMRQRGLSEHDARKLQMFGFVNQVVEKIPVGELTGMIESMAAAKIEEM